MKVTSNRLFFIDAIRAWAILMMLQGHFIDGLLDSIFRNPENPIYNTWLYFRGITAPVFFTVSGFIFTYLLLRAPEQGRSNPRIRKGIKRGLQLLLIGYALRLNIFGLFKGEIYNGFFFVDVLHCIGLSILAIIGFYHLTIARRKSLFPIALVTTTILLFLFEPIYTQWSFLFLPTGIANYFTKVNGSVFTIIPWLGYTTMGAALSILFIRRKNFKHLYPIAIISALCIGLGLIYLSSPLFMSLYETTRIELFQLVYFNNYLFIRLGDVFVVFGLFMLLRKFLTHATLLKIGSSTLSIYVIHFIILYGSFTGLGLYKFFHHELNPWTVILGAVLFMFACTYLALQYNRHEMGFKEKGDSAVRYFRVQLYLFWKRVSPAVRDQLIKIRLGILRFLASAKN
ncbi:MAG: acyltransferase family protein [Bacteroidota bacterium]